MRISDWSSDVCSSDLLVLSGEYRVLPEAEAASAARAINVALSVREHAQLFAPADAPIVEIMCPCPVCRSDVAGIVPCMAVIQNPARVAAPTGSFSHSLSVGRVRPPAHSPQHPKRGPKHRKAYGTEK